MNLATALLLCANKQIYDYVLYLSQSSVLRPIMTLIVFPPGILYILYLEFRPIFRFALNRVLMELLSPYNPDLRFHTNLLNFLIHM
jgi:hypothetical protein